MNLQKFCKSVKDNTYDFIKSHKYNLLYGCAYIFSIFTAVLIDLNNKLVASVFTTCFFVKFFFDMKNINVLPYGTFEKLTYFSGTLVMSGKIMCVLIDEYIRTK